MSRVQTWVRRYVAQEFELGKVQLHDEGEHNVRVMDGSGESLLLTTNLYGDIMDARTKEIIAECDVPHDLDQLSRSPYREPQHWTNRPEWFAQHQSRKI